MIELINVSKYFGERQVLKSINTCFEDGKVNLIIGRSGSGKTVMMKNLIGLLAPEEGEILYNGRNFHQFTDKEKESIRSEMGMVFQGSAQKSCSGLTTTQIRQKCFTVLKTIPI